MEYALNLDPNAGPPAGAEVNYDGLPVIQEDGSDIAIIYRKNLDATDVTYTVEESDDVGITDPWAPSSVTETVLSDDGQTRVIKASLTPTHLPMMVRLKVSR